MMYKIYVLINPLTRLPFYVGATKNSLNSRLNNHIRDAKDVLQATISLKKIMYKRALLINELCIIGKPPIVELITTFDDNTAIDKMESHYYNFYTNSGITLLQSPYIFTYESHNCVPNKIRRSNIT